MDCRVWRAVRLVRQDGLWRACVCERVGVGGPFRGARGCAQWWACVSHWVGNGEGEAGGVAAGFACVVSAYVFACSGALVWSRVGSEVRSRSLPSSAAPARISQMSVRIWCTSWLVVERGYCRGGLRHMRRRTLWMAWYPQVRERCVLGRGVLPCFGARLDLCVGGGDAPDPCGRPAVLVVLLQAEHA